jgi:hypothetical protein
LIRQWLTERVEQTGTTDLVTAVPALRQDVGQSPTSSGPPDSSIRGRSIARVAASRGQRTPSTATLTHIHDRRDPTSHYGTDTALLPQNLALAAARLTFQVRFTSQAAPRGTIRRGAGRR